MDKTMNTKYDKTVAPRVWKRWKIVSHMVREDEAGQKWEAVFKIQNFYIRRVK